MCILSAEFQYHYFDFAETSRVNRRVCCRILIDIMAGDDDDGGRWSELSYEQLQRLHQQVLANWTQSDREGAGGSEFDLLHAPGVRAALVATYVVIIAVGMFGNGLVVVVATSRVPRSSPAAKNSLQVH